LWLKVKTPALPPQGDSSGILPKGFSVVLNIKPQPTSITLGLRYLIAKETGKIFPSSDARRVEDLYKYREICAFVYAFSLAIQV